MIRRENAPTATTVTTTTATTTITTTVLALAEQLDKANQILHMAIASNEQRRKELLEQALLAYADTLPYADPVVGRVIIKQIHAIEQWLELLINESNSSISISNSNSTSALEEEEYTYF